MILRDVLMPLRAPRSCVRPALFRRAIKRERRRGQVRGTTTEREGGARRRLCSSVEGRRAEQVTTVTTELGDDKDS